MKSQLHSALWHLRSKAAGSFFHQLPCVLVQGRSQETLPLGHFLLTRPHAQAKWTPTARENLQGRSHTSLPLTGVQKWGTARLLVGYQIVVVMVKDTEGRDEHIQTGNISLYIKGKKISSGEKTHQASFFCLRNIPFISNLPHAKKIPSLSL